MIYLNTLPENPPMVLGCDIETSGHGPYADYKPYPKYKGAGLDPYLGKIISIAFSDGTDTWIITHDFERAIPILTNPLIVKIFQNAAFDLKWIKLHLGVDVISFFDTMLAEQVLIGGKDNTPSSLLEIIARRCGVIIEKETREEFYNHPGFDIEPMTPEQEQYIVNDVLYLNKIRKQQINELKESGMFSVLKDIELRVVPAVVTLELGGISFDVDLWYKQLEEYNEVIERSDKAIRAHAGADMLIQVPRKNSVEEISVSDLNLNSNPQLQALLLQRYGLELDSTRAEILEDIIEGRFVLDKSVNKDVVEILKNLQAIRKWKKRKSYDYPRFIHPITGKIHPSYNQIGAATGRFSCSNPNMQQPVRPVAGEPNMRHLFVGDTEDYVIIRADYSQNEVRIMAQLSGDKNLIAGCNAKDVYIELGKILYGYEIEKGSEERHLVKTLVLAIGFGAGPEELSARSGKPLKDCIRLRNQIRQRFPQMARFARETLRQAEIYGFVTTAAGRRRYIKGKRAYTQAVNAPVQGTAADMFKLALANIDKFLTAQIKAGKIDVNSRVWNIVHDEVEVHCHKDDAEYLKKEICRIMEEAGHQLCPDVEHVAEAEYSYRWDK